jgi:hypothetical protein
MNNLQPLWHASCCVLFRKDIILNSRNCDCPKLYLFVKMKKIVYFLKILSPEDPKLRYVSAISASEFRMGNLLLFMAEEMRVGSSGTFIEYS